MLRVGAHEAEPFGPALLIERRQNMTCVYRKLKLGRSDGERRRGSGVNE
jgi:hypothetical protein